MQETLLFFQDSYISNCLNKRTVFLISFSFLNACFKIRAKNSCLNAVAMIKKSLKIFQSNVAVSKRFRRYLLTRRAFKIRLKDLTSSFLLLSKILLRQVILAKKWLMFEVHIDLCTKHDIISNNFQFLLSERLVKSSCRDIKLDILMNRTFQLNV